VFLAVKPPPQRAFRLISVRRMGGRRDGQTMCDFEYLEVMFSYSDEGCIRYTTRYSTPGEQRPPRAHLLFLFLATAHQIAHLEYAGM